MKALSIKQPWASLIVNGIKDVENRTWKCPKKYIGQRVLIHASAAKTSGLMARYLSNEQLLAFREKIGWSGLDFLEPQGAIIGSVEIVDYVINHPSIWAEKSRMLQYRDPIYNWVLANPILFPEPINAKGKLSFWDYPNIIAEPEEKGGELFCHCQLPVKEESQVMSIGNYQYQCRYCGGLWYK